LRLPKQIPVLLLAVMIAVAMAPSGAAAPLPPDRYEVRYTSITLSLGTMLQYSATPRVAGILTVPNGAGGDLALPTFVPVFPTVTSFGGLLSSTVTILPPVTATIDPATGAAQLSTQGYAQFSGDATAVPQLGIGVFSCSVGSPAAPIAMTLTTATGARWSPSTATVVLRGSTPLPGADCVEDADEVPVNTIVQSQAPLTAEVRAIIWPPGKPLPAGAGGGGPGGPGGGSGGGPGGGGGGGGPGGGGNTPGGPGVVKGDALWVITQALLVRADRTARVRLRCILTDSRCRGRVRLDTVRPRGASAATVLASKRYSIPAGATRNVKLRISRRAMKALKRRGRLTARLTVSSAGADPIRRRVTIRLRG
jgi:uncharacterized membrane protein YgcG